MVRFGISIKYLLFIIIKCILFIFPRGQIKLADFGLARLYQADVKERPYTNKVIHLFQSIYYIILINVILQIYIILIY